MSTAPLLRRHPTADKEGIDPEATYRATMGFVCAAGRAFGGQRFLGSDPLVQAAPHQFVRDTVPEKLAPHPLDRVTNQHIIEAHEKAERQRCEFEAACRKNPLKLEAPPLVKARRDIYARHAGRPTLIRKGSVLLATDPIVVSDPAAFGR